MTAPQTIAPWCFATAPAGARRAQVVLAAFGRGPLHDEVALSLSQFGAPAGFDPGLYDLRTVVRAADPAWFDGWRSGSLRHLATQELGPEGLVLLDAADHVHLVSASLEAPGDLVYLQGAWVLARHLVARGAAVVLDAHAMRFHRALPEAAAPLDLTRELTVVFETDSRRTGEAHALHTRGMIKFGAPDLVALCTDDDAALVGQVVRELAGLVAQGTQLRLPRHGVQVAPGETWYAVPDDRHLAQLLQLNNEALVLVGPDGRDLPGCAARLRLKRT